MSAVDYLQEDTLLPDGQKFICISFLTDKENKSTLSGIKFRGGFPTYELACDHAKKVQSIDPYFNVFVGEAGKWLPFDPAPDSKAVQDSEYANEQLNTMMKAYMENQEKAKVYHEQRKTEMVRKNVLDNLSTRQDNLKEVQKKLKKAKLPSEKVGLEASIKSIEEEIKKMEGKKDELDVQIEDLSKQVGTFNPDTLVRPKIIGGEDAE
jgi:hypothetical protein